MHDFQRGAFYLAIKERLPIVPIVFSNYYFLDEERKIFDPGKFSFVTKISKEYFHCSVLSILGHITIEALPPINTEKMSTDDVSMLMEKIRNTMMNTLRQLSSKLTPPTIEQLRRNYKS